MSPDLLFPGLRQREAWESMDRHAYDAVAADLNIEEAISYFCGRDGEVHEAYLKYPCPDIESAEYRLDILTELLENNELFTDIRNVTIKLRSLKSEYFEYLNEKILLQKQYRTVYLINDWAELVSTLEKSIKPCKSKGLSELYLYLQDKRITGILRATALKAASIVKRFQEMLNLVVRVNHRAGLLQVLHRDKHENRIEKLSEKILEIFGENADFSFSVVDPNPFSVLEEFIIETQRSEYFVEFRILEELTGVFCTMEEDLRNLIALLPQLLFYTSYTELVHRLRKEQIYMTRPVYGNRWMADNAVNLTMVFHFLNKNRSLADTVQNRIKMNKNDIVIITGANQGGKSTYAKSIAVISHFAQCGLYVSSERCNLPWYNALYTHFTHREKTEEGRLREEVERMARILEKATESTLVLLNESFSSTRRRDGLNLARYYLDRFNKKGCTVLFVTHLNELIAINKAEDKKYVCLGAEVDAKNNRTFKITDCKENIISYARDIAVRCGLTYEQLKLDFEVKKD